jgi:flavodoxin
MAKTLVVFYSRTGTTRRLAESLARELQADVEEITERGTRWGWSGYLRSSLEALLNRAPRIDRSGHDPAGYDLVVIGTPVWSHAISAPVRAFLREHGHRMSRTAFFCTCTGNGSAHALRQMRELVGKPPVAELVMTAETANAPRFGALHRFVQSLTGRVSGAPPSPTPA